ncbi:MAG: hypothetical protein QGG80_01220 [Candidatus Krumholzibacteria bacterium]|jgi:peptidoglycan hydrolase CwlO-like protein|nr:hypothetical protein [Candidatus Krumholzibacteria bacterium]MDP6796508.1 hypothetical protein [Candidatus Krumholzibacteria bacterium]MDP7021927.1 hypothetical protein [Candidatus Krumholzibacteria bacterium]
MSGKKTISAGILLLLAMILVGCACPPPPCDTEVSQVTEARETALAAEEALAEVQAELKNIRAELAELQGKIKSEEDLDALKAKLEELKKGSGRQAGGIR